MRAARDETDEALRELFASLRSASGATGSAPARTPAQEKLLAAALEIFAEQGFDSATTRAIAARAGVAEKTLFQHFGTKSGMFNEAVFPMLVELMGPAVFGNVVRAIQGAGPDFRSRLRAIVRDRVALTSKHPALLKFIAQEMLLRRGFRRPFIEHWKSQLLPVMRAAIESAEASGELRDIPASRVLRILVSMVVGYALTRHVLLPELEWNDEEEVDTMIDVLLHGVSARGRGASAT